MNTPLKPLVMTPQTKNRLRAWLITGAALLPALGWAWSVIDNRYVRRDEYIVRVMLDSINNVTTQAKLDNHAAKLDSILTRITQIECGNATARGCR